MLILELDLYGEPLLANVQLVTIFGKFVWWSRRRDQIRKTS